MVVGGALVELPVDDPDDTRISISCFEEPSIGEIAELMQ